MTSTAPRARLLCLHGFTGTPADVAPVMALADARGWDARAPMLAGHGGGLSDLAGTRFDDWLADARGHLQALLAEGDAPLFLVGFSMGSLLALVLAQGAGDRISGLVAAAPPIRLWPRDQAFLQLVRRFPVLARLRSSVPKAGGPDVSDERSRRELPSLPRIPIGAAASILDGQERALALAGRIATPSLIIHGARDHTATLAGARLLLERLPTPRRRLIVLPRTWHHVFLDVDAALALEAVARFVDDPRAVASAPPGAGPPRDQPIEPT